jgi:hypothetical protein
MKRMRIVVFHLAIIDWFSPCLRASVVDLALQDEIA